MLVDEDLGQAAGYPLGLLRCAVAVHDVEGVQFRRAVGAGNRPWNLDRYPAPQGLHGPFDGVLARQPLLTGNAPQHGRAAQLLLERPKPFLLGQLSS